MRFTRNASKRPAGHLVSPATFNHKHPPSSASNNRNPGEMRSIEDQQPRTSIRRPCTPSRFIVALTIGLIPMMISRWLGGVVAQCPENTLTSFEKIGGVTIKDSQLSLLYTAPNISALSALGSHNQLGASSLSSVNELSRQFASATNLNIPITAECNNRCRRSKKCRAFLVDYARHTCWSVEQQAAPGASSSSSAGLMRAPPPINLVPTQQRTAYFEKVCLNLPTSDFCERAWIYERVIGYHVQGHDDRIVNDVASRLKCQELCVTEREFRCRSGEYDYVTMQCRLSMIDRHTKPNLFRPAAHSIDYFENQCVPVGNQCDAFDRFEDMDLGRAEIMRSANTSDQCQEFCTQTIKAFICRSFTWNPITGKCYLNSANSFMVGGLDQLISAPGLTYYQRNDCIDLKLECDNTAMTLNLRTNEPFRGRMYVRDDPNNCEMMGRSSLVSTLSIPFQSRARCAQREPPNRYSSVVVVQQHPKIQRKSDRYIKVVCDFQTANKTITSTYDVVANPWTSAALINATSFAPKIKLRITDKFGEDIAGAKLGDELQLRIEAETESVYDMVARSVLAKSGNTDESIMLIDKDGCPTDFRIFPPLKKLNRRTIVGRFDAFKFSSDVVVRFQVDVQFCLNQCPSTTCDNSLLHHTNTAQLNGDTFESVTPPAETATSGGPPIGSGVSTSTTTTSQPSLDNSLDDQPHMSLNHLSHHHHQHSLAGQYHQKHDGLVSAYSASSSTQPPVPFQRATPSYSSPNDPSTRPMPQLALSSNHSDSVFAGNHGPQSVGGNYYYNSPSNTNNRQQHPSAPANNPPTQLNFTLSTTNSNNQQQHHSNSLLDVLAPTSDPQVFEGQARSAPVTNSADNEPKRQKQAPVLDNAIDGGQDGVAGQLDQTSGSGQVRRRRSAEPMPQGPRHVPLQREIIVSETTGPAKKSHASQQHQASQQQQLKSARRRDGKSKDDAAADEDAGGMSRNGPAYDLNGNKMWDSEQQSDSRTLLCTTRHSFVIATIAFCAIQFLTIAFCLVIWLHRRDSKFKVAKHQQQHQRVAAARAQHPLSTGPSPPVAGSNKWLLSPVSLNKATTDHPLW